MSILLSQTYNETTPESVEFGDFSDFSFIFEDEAYTFRELVDKLRDYCHLSQTGEPSRYTGASTGFEVTDYATGTETELNLHFSHQNPDRKVKYWIKALKIAGLYKPNH